MKLKENLPIPEVLREANFTSEGIDVIDSHLRKSEISNNGELWANNKVMMERMKAINEGRLEPTPTDKAFYTHELREAELMNQDMSYKEAHAQVCKEYGITAEMERNNPFYTEEANNAWYEEMMRLDN